MMMSSWMGSDFNNDDLVSEFSLLEDYSYELVRPGDAGEGHLYVRCEPKEGLPIVWGHILLVVREKDYLPVREEYFDEKGKLMRVMYFRDIKEFSGRRIPSVMELVPETEEGHRTVLEYQKARFDFAVDVDIFSLRNLRSR